jgi:hypothetical protein
LVLDGDTARRPERHWEIAIVTRAKRIRQVLERGTVQAVRVQAEEDTEEFLHAHRDTRRGRVIGIDAQHGARGFRVGLEPEVTHAARTLRVEEV